VLLVLIVGIAAAVTSGGGIIEQPGLLAALLDGPKQ
jgi:hypothetical protein